MSLLFNKKINVFQKSFYLFSNKQIVNNLFIYCFFLNYCCQKNMGKYYMIFQNVIYILWKYKYIIKIWQNNKIRLNKLFEKKYNLNLKFILNSNCVKLQNV